MDSEIAAEAKAASGKVAVSREINVPADQLFDILIHSVLHTEIDGSGMLRGSIGDVAVSGVGDTFTIKMYNDTVGDYEMTNRVVEYEAGRCITWVPTMTAASSPEHQEHIGNSANHRWGYTLQPIDEHRTLVTERFDCSDSPEWLREATQEGATWVPAMEASLEKLEALAVGSAA